MRIFAQLALFSVVGYVAWRNRFRIQQFLEAQGIRTPWISDTLKDTVRSGVAKVSGRLSESERKVI